jgi:hypothetical protein
MARTATQHPDEWTPGKRTEGACAGRVRTRSAASSSGSLALSSSSKLSALDFIKVMLDFIWPISADISSCGSTRRVQSDAYGQLPRRNTMGGAGEDRGGAAGAHHSILHIGLFETGHFSSASTARAARA